jgi:hypothetical protein
VTPAVILLGNLLVDDVVLADGTTRMGQAGGALLYSAKYMEYLAGQFKKSEDAQVKAGLQKSYKILRTLGDDSGWNLLILREYANLAALEANEEKSDALAQQTQGTDDAQMKGYEDRGKYREVLGTKFTREIVLK